MKILLVQKGVSVDDELKRFIGDKVNSTLRRLSHRVRWVRILLEDTNGPRGGMDKRCVVSVGGDTVETRVADVTNAGLHGAVAGALEIAAQSLTRALKRERTTVLGRRAARRTGQSQLERADASASG